MEDELDDVTCNLNGNYNSDGNEVFVTVYKISNKEARYQKRFIDSISVWGDYGCWEITTKKQRNGPFNEYE